VPNIDHQDVILLLSAEAKRAFPRRPRKAVLLEWAVDDPRTVRRSEAQITAAYEAAYTYIQSQIRDLVSAIRDASRL
jgi:protein-tyrosine-phosphatase